VPKHTTQCGICLRYRVRFTKEGRTLEILTENCKDEVRNKIVKAAQQARRLFRNASCSNDNRFVLCRLRTHTTIEEALQRIGAAVDRTVRAMPHSVSHRSTTRHKITAAA